MANTKRTKASKVSAEDSTVPAPQNVQVKVTEKKVMAQKRTTRGGKKTNKTAESAEAASTGGALKSRKRTAEEVGEAPAKKKGKVAEMKSTAERYPAAQLDVSENEAVDPDKVKPTKKGPTNVGTGKKAAVSANVKSVDDSAKKGPSNTAAGKKVAMAIDIGSADEDMSSEDNPSSDQGGITSVDSDIELSSSDVDMESEPEKKAGMRKPTKRALENSMNETPYFPTDKQQLKSTSGGEKVGAASMVKVKVEKANDDDADEDEDEDEDGGHNAGHDDATRTAAMIYKKALKILKFKLYFENFFPTDDEKIDLPSTCWAAAIASIGEINGGPAAARRMLHDFEYDEMLDKRVSSIRNSLVTKAGDHYERYYDSMEKKSAALKDDRYVYPGDPDTPADTELVYRNNLICDILKRKFFTGRDTLPKLFPKELSNRVNTDGYIEMPEPLVAAAATLIYGLLRRDTLTHADGTWKFSADAHQTTYLKHINFLNVIKSKNSVGHSVLLANIYRKASGVTMSNAAAAAVVKMNTAGMSQAYD